VGAGSFPIGAWAPTRIASDLATSRTPD